MHRLRDEGIVKKQEWVSDKREKGWLASDGRRGWYQSHIGLGPTYDRANAIQTGAVPKASDNDSLTADFTGVAAIFRVVRARTRLCLFFPADFFPFKELACIMH